MLIIVWKRLQTNKVSSTKTTKNRATKSSNPKHSVCNTYVFDLHLPMERIRHRVSSSGPPLSFLLLRLKFGSRFPCSVLQRLSKWGPLVLIGSSAWFWGVYRFKDTGHWDILIPNSSKITAFALFWHSLEVLVRYDIWLGPAYCPGQLIHFPQTALSSILSWWVGAKSTPAVVDLHGFI